MLGNQVELWETLLAAMKLGAVVIPATTQLRAADLRDRLDRGGARHVVVAASATGAVRRRARRLHPHRGRAARRGLAATTATADAASADFTPDGVTRADDPLLLYFTSGTTARPKLVEHTHASYPVGHLSTMYWIGLEPGDVHLNISSPGWAKHAWSNVFAPWNAEACVLVDELRAVRRRGRARRPRPLRGHELLRAADGVADADPGRPDRPAPRRRAKVVGRGRAAQPRGHRAGRAGVGACGSATGSARPRRPCRSRNTPGQPVKPGSMGRPIPGYTVALIDPATGAPADEGEICLDLGRGRSA